MNLQMIFAGFGGQGVLLMGQLIAYAGMVMGKEVSWMPSYGPEMRGGSANCSVVVSDEPVGSPRVEDADVVVAMNKPSLAVFEKSVVPGGLLIYNSSLIDVQPTRTDIRVAAIPANDIAAELGSAKVTNMVMLGALYGAADMPLTKESQMEAIRKNGKPAFVESNLNCFERGFKAASEETAKD